MLLPLLCALTLAADPSLAGLDTRIAPLADAHKGKVAVAVKHIVTGDAYYLNADAVMPTASLIKVAVLIETYHQLDEGKLKLTDRVTLREADKVPGSGLLTKHFGDGTTFSLRDALHLMMAVSDNTATNLILDRVGVANVNKRMEAWGLKETRINAKVFRGSTTSVDPERTKLYGLGSTTAREMAKLMEDLQTGDRLRPALKQSVLGYLRQNEDTLKFPRLLPPGTVVAHKDGSLSEARTDAGIIHTPTGPVVVVVLTNQNQDRRWANDNAGDLLCARVALAVYEHFRGAPTIPGQK
jgi:beta-lactamase class A